MRLSQSKLYWNKAARFLVRLRLLRCYMCDNQGADGGCSCGACGIVEGSPWGYSWCARFVGCTFCGRDTE